MVKMHRRLIIYNVLIIVISALLIFGLVSFANWSTHEIVRSFESETSIDRQPAQPEPDITRLDFRKPRAVAEQLSTTLSLIITASVTIILGLDLLLSNLLYRRLVRATAEAEARQAAAYAAAKQKMLHGISHDLRTPLTAVKGHLKGLQDGVAKTPAKRAEYLQVAYNRTLDIENLISQLFTIFDYETGELQFNLQPCNFGQFIRDAVSSNEHVVSGAVQVEFDFPRTRVMLSLDEVQFKRVLDNLITNTVKHSRLPSHTAPTISLQLRHSGAKTVFTYADNGGGVKPASLPHLFEEFFKEDSSRSQDKTSSGLGLFVVRQIIEGHHGTIVAENVEGHHGAIVAQNTAAPLGLKFTLTFDEEKAARKRDEQHPDCGGQPRHHARKRNE